jgi:thiol-disulfide isomerase/thioredoxin
MSDIPISKTRPAAKPANARKQQSDDYDDNPDATAQYAEYEDDDGYYEDEEEAVVSVNGKRAIALAVTGMLVVAIFGVAIWMFLGQSRTPPGGGPVQGVPTIAGFNADTAQETQAPTKGAFAPDFVWQENGQTVSLSSFRGKKPVFVNFWGTWCPPCRAEMPEMQNLYNAKRNDIEIVGVSMGPRDWPKLVLDFVNASSYNWKFVHDNDYSVATRYQVVSVPSSYFIDKNGVIQAVHVGAMNRSMMDSYLQQTNTN